jgi:hypothetical protein
MISSYVSNVATQIAEKYRVFFLIVFLSIAVIMIPWRMHNTMDTSISELQLSCSVTLNISLEISKRPCVQNIVSDIKTTTQPLSRLAFFY